MNFAHIRAMIEYEARMQWRSRSWHVVIFGFTAIILFGLMLTPNIGRGGRILSRDQIRLNYVQYYSMDPETRQPALVLQRVIDPQQILGEGWESIPDSDLERASATVSAFYSLWFGLMMLMFATLLFMADVVPLDRQHNIRPLLDSTRLTLTTYLAGKVIAVWVSTLKIAIGGVLIVGVFSWLIFGPFNIAAFLTACVAAFIPATLFASALGVLAASPAITRRRAILIATILIPLCGLAYFKTLFDLWGLTMIPEPLLHFTVMGNRGFSNTELIQLALNTLLAGLGILAAAWIVAWGSQRWQTSR